MCSWSRSNFCVHFFQSLALLCLRNKNLSVGFICYEIHVNSDHFFDFGAEVNIGTMI